MGSGSQGESRGTPRAGTPSPLPHSDVAGRLPRELSSSTRVFLEKELHRRYSKRKFHNNRSVS